MTHKFLNLSKELIFVLIRLGGSNRLQTFFNLYLLMPNMSIMIAILDIYFKLLIYIENFDDSVCVQFLSCKLL